MSLSALFLIITYLAVLFRGIGAIKVKLIIPKHVREHSSPTFFCDYGLEGKPLYSVKWYRGQYEFFRFIPLADPPFAAFPLGGLDVDIFHSNAHQVTLKNVPKYISGKITCEVSIDETFKTASDSSELTITDAHIEKPCLNVSSNRLFPVEELEINCVAEETDPPPLVNFYINNVKVHRSMIKILGNGKAALNSSVLLYYIEQIQENGNTPPVWLKCDSYVGGLYHLSSDSVQIITRIPKHLSSSVPKTSGSLLMLLVIPGIFKNL